MAGKIQIDMYEVQLGASLLLYFEDNAGKPIQILADAGITVKKDKGYLQDHVYKKIRQTLGQGRICLDLIIGTHYDEDHLYGLIPVIDDDTINVTEAWLPPVANDTEVVLSGERVLSKHLLVRQFEGEDGREKLREYLKAKQTACEELRSLEIAADEFREDTFARNYAPSRQDKKSFIWNGSTDTAVSYFEAHRREAMATLSEEDPDSDTDGFFTTHIDNPWEVNPLQGWHPFFRPFLDLDHESRQNFFDKKWRANPARAKMDAIRLAYLRKSSAKDAITATHLAAVVAALKKRKIPIICHMIEDGKPIRFVWDRSEMRFIAGKKLTSDGPTATLLGPSQGLVKKLRDKLPVGDYLSILAYEPITVRTITASNQLSYVLKFEAENQCILVCGDAGCVDFKSNSGSFYSDLLDSLQPLHVIQIAHHGGCNANFYNVLLAAGYPEQKDKSFLLLSHATDDATRPSKEFRDFIGQARRSGDDMQLLFTSRPSKDKVRDFLKIIHEPVGESGDAGDVRLRFNGMIWNVEKHAVSLNND